MSTPNLDLIAQLQQETIIRLANDSLQRQILEKNIFCSTNPESLPHRY